jgi:hypothetical protein
MASLTHPFFNSAPRKLRMPLMRYRLQMIRINAQRIFTRVVDIKLRRNGPPIKLVRGAMSLQHDRLMSVFIFYRPVRAATSRMVYSGFP